MTFRWRCGVVAVLGVLLVSGCGGSSGGDGKAPEASVASSATTTANGADTSAAATGNGKGASPAISSIDACALVSDEEVASAFVTTNPQWASSEFRLSDHKKVGADSPDGVACEYFWTVVDAAQGTFVVEVVPGDYFALATGSGGTEPVDGFPGAKHSQGGAYAEVKGLTLAVLGVGTNAVRGTLLKAAAARLG